MTKYNVTMDNGYKWNLLGDFTQASCPLGADFWGDGAVQGTPYQVADARHIPWDGAKLVYDHFRQSDEDEEVVLIEAAPQTERQK